jgi:hypothetical protein
MDPELIKALAAATNLTIPNDRLQGVVENFTVIMRMAPGLMVAEFSLPALENAPVFDAWAGSAK